MSPRQPPTLRLPRPSAVLHASYACKRQRKDAQEALQGMKYTAGQAAEATGFSTATITRAIKKGKISAVKDASGAWSIDPSELHRVFPPLADMQDSQETMQRDAIVHESLPLQLELEMTRERLKGVEALANERAEQIADLRSRLDAEAEERRRLTALLTFQPERSAPTIEPAPASAPLVQPPQPRRLSWWQRLTGAGS